jgi:hypothetical protein
MKLAISIGVLVFSSLGAWLGSLMDHGNGFGGWAILWSTAGGFIGIWVGYKFAKNYL